MTTQNLTAKRFDFTLKYNIKASLLEPKVETTDSGEERGDFVGQSQDLHSERNENMREVDSSESAVKFKRLQDRPQMLVCYAGVREARGG